ncbi:MAG: MASE1 domain-containing protein [Candidatus Protochlamydia sp.]|nr:MASE1 domain-containing protein [Candidatus Protochlamydia sp.]
MKLPNISILNFSLVFLAYTLAAIGGHMLSIPPGNVTPLWPPSGIALASMLIIGYRIWPALLIAGFISTLIAFPLITAGTLFGSLIISFGIVIEAFLGAFFLKKLTKTINPINSIDTVFIFMFLSCFVASAVGATIGTKSLMLFQIIPLADHLWTWTTWLLGDFSGCVSVGSTILIWKAFKKQSLARERLLELIILLATVTALSFFIFTGHNQLPFTIIPFIIWAVIRLGPHWGAGLCLLVSLIATFNISKGYFIFGGSTLNESMLLFQTFVIVLFLIDLTLSALLENLYKANRVLETRVQERTADLYSTLETLKRKEAQLLQSEKMSSLGVLTAGIAHEINNPINFVFSSIQPLGKDIDDVLNVLDKYTHLDEQTDNKEAFAEIDALKKELEIDTTLKEIPQLIKGIKEGATRTAAIVKDLRLFSRLDESQLKKANVQEGLEAMLMLMHHQLKDRIALKKDYGEIPEIDCFPGKINQAFLGIFTNAIEAIQGKGTITIKTYRVDEKNIAVSIKDTGKGIPLEIINKIFDPFFTTQPIGSGIGLGLTITYSIIEEHNGSIDVKSEPGVGSEFIVTLPISH